MFCLRSSRFGLQHRPVALHVFEGVSGHQIPPKNINDTVLFFTSVSPVALAYGPTAPSAMASSWMADMDRLLGSPSVGRGTDPAAWCTRLILLRCRCAQPFYYLQGTASTLFFYCSRAHWSSIKRLVSVSFVPLLLLRSGDVESNPG